MEQGPAVKADAPALDEKDQVEEPEAEEALADEDQVADALAEVPAVTPEELEDLDVQDKQDLQFSFQAISDPQYTSPVLPVTLKL